jgi:hypothetical protein
MKDTPKHSFEDEFKKAFDEAEATPSPKLWAQIDAELANKEASIYKRKLYIYKLRVAAAAVLVIGFMGIWLFSSQYSNDMLTDVPVSTNSQQEKTLATTKTGTLPENPASRTDNGTLAPAQAPALTQKETTSSKQAGENALPTENTNQVKNSTSSNTSESPQQPITPTIPETIALDANKEINPASTSRTANRKSHTTQPNPATIDSRNQEALARQNPADNSTTPVTRGERAAEEATNRNLLSEQPNPDLNNPANNTLLAKQTPLKEQTPAKDKFSSDGFNRITKKVSLLDNTIAIQAPRVTVKPNPSVWVEEKEEKESSQSASRWAVGLAFAPSQFNSNIQVNPQASASLSNARNMYYNRTAAPVPVNTYHTLRGNTSVGKELENAENINLSYNVGVDVGYALSEKFSLHSGLLYLHNNSQITTDNYLQNSSNQEKYPEFMALIQPSFSNTNADYAYAPAPVNVPANTQFQTLEMAISNKYAESYPGVTEVIVYNTYQYLSIPLSLHYQLLDKKVSATIGAGVSADLFMKNTIGNPEDNVTNQEFNRSDNGPYKNMSFSGLVSARVNYKISSKYSIYLQPNYRTALNSVTNSALVSSKPNAFGIGTGFQYRF